jgi:hypothetical protein
MACCIIVTIANKSEPADQDCYEYEQHHSIVYKARSAATGGSAGEPPEYPEKPLEICVSVNPIAAPSVPRAVGRATRKKTRSIPDKQAVLMKLAAGHVES